MPVRGQGRSRRLSGLDGCVFCLVYMCMRVCLHVYIFPLSSAFDSVCPAKLKWFLCLRATQLEKLCEGIGLNMITLWLRTLVTPDSKWC